MPDIKLSPEQFSFIPKIYETITNQGCWTDVLEEFARHCGAGGASLMLGDLVNPEITLLPLSHEFAPKIMEEYIAKHTPDDAKAMSIVANYPAFTWITDEQAFGMPGDEIPGNIFTSENFGLNRKAGVRLTDTPIWLDGMSLNFRTGRGNITPEEDATSQLFLPHFAKAVEISRPFLLLQKRYQAILNVLDHLQIGIVIVDAHGNIVMANREADNVLSANNGISPNREKRLQLADSDLQGQLQQRITSASQTDHPDRYAPVLAVPKRDGELPWLLEVFPLTNIDGDLSSPFRGAAVFITDPSRKEIISTAGLAALFGLTDAENEVCEMLTKGLRVAEVAEERNTSVDTTRSQIKTLFSKTETTSQSDLVRLALKVNLPVDRPDQEQ